MPQLSIDVVLVALLVTTFATFGLLGLWLGASRWRWLPRGLCFLAPLLPLAAVPAKGAVLLLMAQGLTCAAGAQAYLLIRRRRKKRSVELPRKDSLRIRRFSIADALSGMTLMGVALSVFALMRGQSEDFGLLGAVLTGQAIALPVLAVGWATHSYRRRVVRVFYAALTVITTSLLLALFNDWLDFIADSRDLSAWLAWPPIASFDWTPLWIPIASGASFLVAFALWLLHSSGVDRLLGCGPIDSDQVTGTRAASIGLFALLFVVVTFPTATCWELLTPSELPRIEPPSPNAYDELASAGKRIGASQILNMAIEPQNTAELSAEVAKYSAEYELIDDALREAIANPRWRPGASLEDIESSQLNGIQSFRSVARALSMRSRLAREEGRFQDAATDGVRILELGAKVATQGVVIDYLVGAAIAGFGHSDLSEVVDQLEPESRRALIDRLTTIESRSEPIHKILERDRIWSENALGWTGHLYEFLWGIAGDHWNESVLRGLIDPRDSAMIRLLAVKCSLGIYEAEHSELPSELDELASIIAPRMLYDPFTNGASLLVYRRAEEGYTLYSVGPNGRDDGGVEADAMAVWETGDIGLDLRGDE